MEDAGSKVKAEGCTFEHNCRSDVHVHDKGSAMLAACTMRLAKTGSEWHFSGTGRKAVARGCTLEGVSEADLHAMSRSFIG